MEQELSMEYFSIFETFLFFLDIHGKKIFIYFQNESHVGLNICNSTNAIKINYKSKDKSLNAPEILWKCPKLRKKGTYI